MGEVAKTRKRKKRSAKPEKVLVYDSHTICSRSSSFMGGVAEEGTSV